MALAYLLLATLIVACSALLIAYTRAQRQIRLLVEEREQAVRVSEQQQQTLREHRHLETIKDEFISTVSHELRTPLTSIRGALGLLSSGMLGQVDATALNLLRIASTNTDRLVRLINDILDLERMDSERASLQIHRCSLPELLVQAVETMAPMAEAAGVSVEIVPESGGDIIVFDGDPDRVLQLLCNLLSNAIKFSPEGAPIRVLSSTTPTDFVLRMEDAGRGIPADQLETIFNRFQQVEPGDSRQKGGTGLGLAICRSIAIQHGGNIWAERNDTDKPGRPGSTFVLQLPRIIIAESMPMTPAIKPSGTILVCDDDAGVRHILAEQLRQHGYTVLEAERGEQAIQLAEHQPIEAILLDLYMPGLSGWETLERLKHNPATADIPVVVLSALSPAAKPTRGAPLIAAAQGWVQKPFTETLLLAELGRVLRASAGPGRILLVEDDNDLATVVLSQFEAGDTPGEEVSIQHVRSLHQAKAACIATPPDILILDVGLPDGTGFALVGWLRQQPALCNLPLIVYSGRHLSEPEMEQLRLGPTQFLPKDRVEPHDVEELVRTMVRHLRTAAPASPASTSIDTPVGLSA
ncbi:MAG TPA: response regulator [Terracidiphilus sp.]|nr:response regulator [Terracidiphilus sp.]